MEKVILKGQSTYDGAGVKLYRVFANNTAELTDPFLLLDHFGSDNPKDYVKGFPWHPHRGIETVTYMLNGEVEHQDNMGNKGVIGPGDIQWMSAGSGIIHQEMPKGTGLMQGFQLWVNMPKNKKMIAPEYRGITQDMVPLIKKEGIMIKVISGIYEDKVGPAKHLVIDVDYLDIELKEGKSFEYNIKKSYTTFCYIYEGEGVFESTDVDKGKALLIKNGNSLKVLAKTNLKFILVSGKPLEEPIAWGGPIVMNTEEELRTAFQEIREGTFIKK
ncbi:MAG: pirin family protein [Candidatus Nanoarchaeia archaeon]